MLKLSEPRLCAEEDLKALRELFELSFDDNPQVTESFFRETFPMERALGIFDGEKAVSALYLLESVLRFPNGEEKKVFYVYGVSTHPDYRGKRLLSYAVSIAESLEAEGLFLVPAEKTLFSLYEQCGYKTSFVYEEKIVFKDAYKAPFRQCEEGGISFGAYKSFVKSDCPVAVLGKGAFKSFFGFRGRDNGIVFSGKDGFLVFEKNDEGVTVLELWGNGEELIGGLFEKTGVEKISLRLPCNSGEGIPFGMFYDIKKSGIPENAFFGTPYST